MNLSVAKYLFSLGILLFGLLVPILPRVYMIYLRSDNPERFEDAFALLHYPPVYLMTVFPFVVLACVAWITLRQENLGWNSAVKRIAGIVVSLLVLGYWGLSISMPTVWGLAAWFFLFCSILILPVTYWYGGLLGYWIVKWMLPSQAQFAKADAETSATSQIKTKSLRELFNQSQAAKCEKT